LAFFYLQYREFDLALSVAQDIPNRFSLTSQDQKDYQSFKCLFNIVKGLKTSSISTLDLSAGQISELKGIKENNHNFLGAYARNLLIAAKQINYREPIILPVFDETTTANDQEGIEFQKSNSYMKVYPNPANTFFNVDYDLSSKSGSSIAIKVFNSLGKLMVTEHLAKKKDQIVIYSKDWVPGIYLLALEIEGSVIESKKISVTR
jgi:hypothetical protein